MESSIEETNSESNNDITIEEFLNKLGIIRKTHIIPRPNGFFTFTAVPMILPTRAKQRKFLNNTVKEGGINKQKSSTTVFELPAKTIKIKPEKPAENKNSEQYRSKSDIVLTKPTVECAPTMAQSSTDISIEFLKSLPVKCNFCNENFQSMKNLDEHHRIHLYPIKLLEMKKRAHVKAKNKQ